MGYNRFSVLLAMRLFVIMLTLAVLAFPIASPDYHAATLLGLIMIIALGFEIFRFVSKTNHEVSRFMDAARYADFSQRFDLGPVGVGFSELGQTFTAIMARFRQDRALQECELRHLKVLVRSVWSPSLSMLWSRARLPPPAKSQFRLDELFREVTRVVMAQWLDKDIALNTSIEPSELDLFSDRDMLEQILINILQNAEYALAETQDGRVSLSARLNKRGHVSIEISDNGPGVADDLERKIFIPFFTTKREGSGVDLALSRQVMLAHRGSITVSRSETGGACFRLVF